MPDIETGKIQIVSPLGGVHHVHREFFHDAERFSHWVSESSN